jgi:hypothetical protein
MHPAAYESVSKQALETCQMLMNRHKHNPNDKLANFSFLLIGDRWFKVELNELFNLLCISAASAPNKRPINSKNKELTILTILANRSSQDSNVCVLAEYCRL